MKKYEINPNYINDFKDFTQNIQEYFHDSTQSIHKARNELKTIQHNGIKTIVKSFKIPNIINRVAYTFFRDSKAKKSYEYSLKIGDFTPQPIAYIEFFNFGFISDSYFISQEFDYDFTIREPLLDEDFPNKDEIFKAFARFSLDLHNNNIFHNDYSPGNILVKQKNGTYIFKIVDINRMKFFELHQQDRAKNFSKLWASDEILKTIASEYQKHYSCDENFITEVLYFSNKNKKIKNFKKRLKGKKVND